MKAQRATKPERIEMRISREHKDIIEAAAALSGQPLTSFAVTTLVERAEEVVARHQSTILTSRDARAFLSLLDDEPNDRLRRAAKKFRAQRG